MKEGGEMQVQVQGQDYTSVEALAGGFRESKQ